VSACWSRQSPDTNIAWVAMAAFSLQNSEKNWFAATWLGTSSVSNQQTLSALEQ